MALNFDDASSQYLEETSATDYVDGDTAMSCSFWLLPDDNDAEHKSFGQWNGQFNQSTFLISRDTSGRIGLLVTDTSGNGFGRRLATGLTAGVAVHLVFTWTATVTSAIYVNGVSQSLENWVLLGTVNTIGSSGSRPKLRIGAVADGGYEDGKMAEVAIWSNRALSADEAKILSNRGSPLLYPKGLVYYCRLIGRIDPEVELMQSKNMTLVNTPTNFTHPAIIYPTGPTNNKFNGGYLTQSGLVFV